MKRFPSVGGGTPCNFSALLVLEDSVEHRFLSFSNSTKITLRVITTS
jgi:hypothetical protein